VLASFFERPPLIPRSGMGKFIESVVGILPVYFPLRSIVRFAYSEYLGSIFNTRDIPGAATRGIIFRSLRMKSSS
jgi:hypothetical protein